MNNMNNMTPYELLPIYIRLNGTKATDGPDANELYEKLKAVRVKRGETLVLLNEVQLAAKRSNPELAGIISVISEMECTYVAALEVCLRLMKP